MSVAAVAASCIIASIASPAAGRPPKTVVTTHPPPAHWPGKVEHVIIVSIDGLPAGMVDEESTPVLMKMIAEGASTLAAQTVSPSLTLPAHCSMMTGLTPDQHRIKWNTYRPALGNLTAATIFDVARDAGATTAIFVGKNKLKHIVQEGDVDVYFVEERNDSDIMRKALQQLHTNTPNLMWIHLPGVDRAGHFAGWKSGRQLGFVREADRLVGSLLDAIEVLDLRDRTVVIVTADHGGEGRHHTSMDTGIRTVPWIVWGDSITHATLPPVSITATATTALRLLGVEIPESWAARDGASPSSQSSPESPP
jgi:predicted AlkP superfamily pyrophosphatase or phosphodiesterase